MNETERKFLVASDDFMRTAKTHYRIVQGYLNSDPERTVRIRLKGDRGYITVKGKSNATGTTRFEWEKEISKEEALQLLPLCEKGSIDKTRYEVPVGRHVFEVDVFHSDNNGLLIAEIELAHEDEQFEKPAWLGEEVTGDERYYNAYLSKKPFNEWQTP